MSFSLNPEVFLTEDVGNGKRVQIEFVSANPTGPLHLGHGRGAAVGAALANLLQETGYRIEKEFYINDAGKQVKMLGSRSSPNTRPYAEENIPFRRTAIVVIT